MKLIQFLLLSFLLINLGVTAIEIDQEDTVPKILLIHSNSTERVSILSIFQEITIPIDIDTRFISNLVNIDLQSYDMIIFVSSNEFDLEENEKDKIVTFLGNPSKFFITFSPFLDEFNDNVETLLGIDEVGDTIPEDNVTNWDLSLNLNLGNLSNGNIFRYTGQYSEIELLPNAVSIASVINSDFEDDITFPQPAIINATTNKAQMITSTLSPFSIEALNSLTLNQIPQLFQVLLTEILFSSVTTVNQTIRGINAMRTDDQDDDSPIERIGSIVPDFQFRNFIVYGLIILFALLITKILGILDWISRKIIGIGILIVGEFYSVEDRILDQKDIYLINRELI